MLFCLATKVSLAWKTTKVASGTLFRMAGKFHGTKTWQASVTTGCERHKSGLVVSLVQLFVANYYSFVCDAMSRLVVAKEYAFRRNKTLRVVMPSNGGELRQFMWPLLRRVGVGSRYDTTVLQYDVLPTEERRSSAWIRMRVDTLLVVDWSHRQGNRSDLHHLPTQFALSMLRERLAFPWGAPAVDGRSHPSNTASWLCT